MRAAFHPIVRTHFLITANSLGGCVAVRALAPEWLALHAPTIRVALLHARSVVVVDLAEACIVINGQRMH